MGIVGRDPEHLFAEAAKNHEEARQNFAAELYNKAYLGALRSLRPLRILMADYWNKATATLDVPTASPYAVSFYTLPRHWALFRELQNRKPGENLLPSGNFEWEGRLPQAGISVDNIAGWTARCGTLDRVNMAAAVISSQRLEEKPAPRELPKPIKGIWAPGREIRPPDYKYERPVPDLGKSLLRLEVRRFEEFDKDGKQVEPPPVPLERTYVTVDSPVVQLPPGTLVRISCWIKIQGDLKGSADGALFFDDACGEPLGLRLLNQPEWKQYHLYRVVPANGQISVTISLTGVGVAYFDNVAIEPMIPNDSAPAPQPENSNVQSVGRPRQ